MTDQYSAPLDDDFAAYATPESDSLKPDLLEIDPEAEHERRRYLKHERAIDFVSVLFTLGGVWMALLCVTFVILIGCAFYVIAFSINPSRDEQILKSSVVMIVLFPVYGAISYLGFWIGSRLRKGRNAARITAVVLLGFSFFTCLVNVPIAFIDGNYPANVLTAAIFTFFTILFGASLHLLLCKKGRRVFYPDYQDVRAHTRHLDSFVWLKFALIMISGNYPLCDAWTDCVLAAIKTFGTSGDQTAWSFSI